jgi:hypothetical protein
VAVVEEADEAQEFVHFGFQDAARKAAEASGELEILAPTEVRIEVGFLGHIAQAALKAFQIAADILAVEEHASAGGFQQSGKHLDGGAFAGTVGAEIAEDLAGTDGEADAIHGGGTDEGLGEIEGFEHRQ